MTSGSAESAADFLERITSEREGFARDEGGFSDETREAITTDAARLRRISRAVKRAGIEA